MSRAFHRAVLLCAVLALLSSTRPADATIVIPMPEEDLASQADAVIVGRVTTMTDTRGVSRFAYDDLGRMTSVMDALNNETRFKYDNNGNKIEETIKGLPDGLAVLKLHYLRWVLFDIGKETYFMYQGIFDTDFDKYTEDAVALFSKYGINTVFENLEGFPEDWKTNTPAFIKFVREHQRPSFLEYGEYPYVSADEIKKALKLKAAFSEMLDQMQ